MRWIAIVAAIVAVIAALSRGDTAHAHASLILSEPADRAVVAQPPSRLTLDFNEPVSPLTLRLVRPSGEVVVLKDVTARGPTLSVGLPTGLTRGTHLLSWRVISADGHPVGGALTFSVGQPSATPAMPRPGQDISLRGAIWLARLVLYVGLFVGIGGAFYSRWIARAPPSRRIATVIAVAQQCGLAAAVISVGLHGLDVAGQPLSDIREPGIWAGGLATSYGLTVGIAAAALLLGLAAMSAAIPAGRWTAALALAGVGVALAASGHAATAGPAWATRPAVFLHGACVAFWVGALLPLAGALHAGQGRAELLRFSRAIPWPLLVLVVTGVLLAVVQLQRVDSLWTTSYGLLLAAKLAAVTALLALAALNRRLTPGAAGGDARATRRLVRSIAIEFAIVVVILGLVASWRFTPPPRSLLAAAAQPVLAHIHAEKAMADLRIEPAGAAGRAVIIGLLDGEFRPLNAKEVVLVLSKPDAGIEPLRLPATHQGETTWRVDGVRLPQPGRWRVRVDILVSDFEKIFLEDEIELR